MDIPSSDSLWTAASAPTFGSLSGDVMVDVAVVGGGIAGLTTASLLQEAGRRVAVVEARSVGRQTTGGSSAKVTAQHSLIYRRLTHTFGSDTARTYAEANAGALEWIAQRVDRLGIECSFARKPAYVYTDDVARLDELKREVETAAGLGLPARFADSIPLPIPAVGAVIFDHQAQFDPYAYLIAEAERFQAGGGLIYEHTRVTDIDTESSPLRAKTDHGTISARDVVLATNLPIVDRGMYYAKAFPIAHLAIAGLVEGDAPEGVFISVDQPTHSLRWHRDGHGRLWIIALGPRFRPGTVDTEEGFREIETFVRGYFPLLSVGHRWWNEDFESADGIPYVGRLTADEEHLYVATGFSGWGITNSIVAGQILAATIQGRAHPWRTTFDSTRTLPARAADEMVKGNLPSARAWLASHVTSPPSPDLQTLQPGDGVVVKIEDQQIAVSRDEDGTLRAVGAECSHRGCLLAWNRAMATWDCSCHGSSFDRDGRVLRGPATSDLETRPIEVESKA